MSTTVQYARATILGQSQTIPHWLGTLFASCCQFATRKYVITSAARPCVYVGADSFTENNMAGFAIILKANKASRRACHPDR